MCAKPLTSSIVSRDVSSFLDEAKQVPIVSDGPSGRLIFAMDATASRGPSWDVAMSIQSDMFSEASALGGLEVQLVFFRGLFECRSSKWTRDAAELGRLMSKVGFLAGRTQIERVLRHVIKEAERGQVNAVVLIGDAMEESLDLVADAAGQLGLKNVPAFIFHEGGGEPAASAFKHIAKVSGGAYSPFDANSPGALRALLRAVAAYAAGGKKALEACGHEQGGDVQRITSQMTRS
ncbi:MAG: VWA domain-containing protein [Rhodospirillaceae bacterium]|jgi:hypothetical protein|nr:VWA domain-containing protein [Rhodospirillaceae bacterium]